MTHLKDSWPGVSIISKPGNRRFIWENYTQKTRRDNLQPSMMAFKAMHWLLPKWARQAVPTWNQMPRTGPEIIFRQLLCSLETQMWCLWIHHNDTILLILGTTEVTCSSISIHCYNKSWLEMQSDHWQSCISRLEDLQGATLQALWNSLTFPQLFTAFYPMLWLTTSCMVTA